MKKVFIAVLLCLVFSFVGFAEQLPTEESLIAAWEEIQKNDSNNTKFEKIKDKEYKIKNNKIPFEGILKINSADIEDVMMGNNDYLMGVVEAELVGLSSDFIEKIPEDIISGQETIIFTMIETLKNGLTCRNFRKH